ncbi:probable methylmalonate-semialdehyde/malonate-semialdehyde dehydrogenase [acylating], mitochondrial [Oscarella lobularis]|uniref:probable methylmalonate-semialdehyde/malonate-semialdehyde dehydrogenase [acylating], mitochondrial n=1 Tax=Oscarella lobularis TaxID=121494 RepID=UPI0033139B20
MFRATASIRSTIRLSSTTKLFINGQFVDSKTNEWIDLHNPATNEVVTRVPCATREEMNSAQSTRQRAPSSRGKTSRFFRDNRSCSNFSTSSGKLAKVITLEQGKSLADAEGDVLRGLQVVEHACSLTSLQLGETLPSISRDMDTISYRVPLEFAQELRHSIFPP